MAKTASGQAHGKLMLVEEHRLLDELTQQNEKQIKIKTGLGDWPKLQGSQATKAEPRKEQEIRSIMLDPR